MSDAIGKWQDEVDSAAEYQSYGRERTRSKDRQSLLNVTKMEESSYNVLGRSIAIRRETVGERRPSWRSRVIARMARRLGPDAVLSTIAAKEAANGNVYVKQPETSGTRMSSQERWTPGYWANCCVRSPKGTAEAFWGDWREGIARWAAMRFAPPC